MTKGVYAYAKKVGSMNSDLSMEELSQLSQKGSGSSCRSFFSPFSIWESEGAESIDVGLEPLKHFALVFEGEKKEVSSSKAHVQVLSSLNFLGRPERATKRLSMLLESFRGGSWKTAYEICWAEFWDMHSLFETSTPSFGYLNGPAVSCLDEIRQMWSHFDDGPLVTMDAGPNIHLLFRAEEGESALKNWISPLKKRFPDMFVVGS
ncbi:MAG: hypothetical protein GW917_02075 [Bdellovibrionales bacterium]|nr:hypothetical protein [Bdellovibrionales bacterium]